MVVTWREERDYVNVIKSFIMNNSKNGKHINKIGINQNEFLQYFELFLIVIVFMSKFTLFWNQNIKLVFYYIKRIIK